MRTHSHCLRCTVSLLPSWDSALRLPRSSDQAESKWTWTFPTASMKTLSVMYSLLSGSSPVTTRTKQSAMIVSCSDRDQSEKYTRSVDLVYCYHLGSAYSNDRRCRVSHGFGSVLQREELYGQFYGEMQCQFRHQFCRVCPHVRWSVASTFMAAKLLVREQDSFRYSK